MLSVFILIAYLIFAIFLIYGYTNYEPFHNSSINLEFVPVTIIIPARNESKHIGKCLESIITQNYPKDLLQVIVIDDNSSDETSNIAEKTLETSGINYQIIKNISRLNKKQSIIEAVKLSNANLIVTRDADTYTTSNKWLLTIVNYYLSQKKDFIICPILFSHEAGCLSLIQHIESKIIMLLTVASLKIGKPFLCSGANLAFTKKLFYDTDAYAKHLHILSGDDVFFLEEVKQLHLNTIGFLHNKEAIACTYPETTTKSLIHQKARWLSKLTQNVSAISWLSAGIIGVVNVYWVICLIWTLFSRELSVFAVIFLFAKVIIDILLVFLASRFFNNKVDKVMVLVAGCVYPFYSLTVSLSSVFIKPKWK